MSSGCGRGRRVEDQTVSRSTKMGYTTVAHLPEFPASTLVLALVLPVLAIYASTPPTPLSPLARAQSGEVSDMNGAMALRL